MKKAIKILPIFLAMIMLFSFGVAFADTEQNARDTHKEKRQEALEEWKNSLSPEDQAKYEEYLGKVEEQKELRETLAEKRKANRELKREIYTKVKACLKDENFELTNEQITLLLDFNNDLRDHLHAIKDVHKNRRQTVKKGAGAIKERDLDEMLKRADEGIAHLNDLIKKADETHQKLTDLKKILE